MREETKERIIKHLNFLEDEVNQTPRLNLPILTPHPSIDFSIFTFHFRIV